VGIHDTEIWWEYFRKKMKYIYSLGKKEMEYFVGGNFGVNFKFYGN
jgi:hypothetical protein